MAAAPRYKVFDRHGVYQAAVKELEAAAAIMQVYDGGTVRLGHTSLVLWHEGHEFFTAGESYDQAA